VLYYGGSETLVKVRARRVMRRRTSPSTCCSHCRGFRGVVSARSASVDVLHIVQAARVTTVEIDGVCTHCSAQPSKAPHRCS
jgi:hypothetical protein